MQRRTAKRRKAATAAEQKNASSAAASSGRPAKKRRKQTSPTTTTTTRGGSRKKASSAPRFSSPDELRTEEDIRSLGVCEGMEDDLPYRELDRFRLLEGSGKLSPGLERMEQPGRTLYAEGWTSSPFSEDPPVRVRLGRLLEWHLEYGGEPGSCPLVWVKTVHANYCLKSPDQEYAALFHESVVKKAALTARVLAVLEEGLELSYEDVLERVLQHSVPPPPSATMTTQNGPEEKEKEEEEEEKEKASPLAKGKEKDCDTTAGMEVVSEAQKNKNQKKVEEVQNEMAEGSQWSVSDVVSNATFIEAQIRGFGDDLLTTCPFMVTLREVIMANKTRKQEKKRKQQEELQHQRMATSVEAKLASSSSTFSSSSSISASASTSSFNTEAGPSSTTKDASPQSSDLDDFALDPSKNNKRRRSKTHYIPKHKTVPEQEVELINENMDDMTNGGDDEDTIPTRLLEDFTVYDLNDKRMVLMDEIWSSTHSDLEMCASGFVTPILSDEQMLEQQQLDDEEGDISEDISEEDEDEEDEEDEAKEDDKDEEIKKEESDTEDFVVKDKNKKGEERQKRRKKNKKRQRNPESGLWVSLTTVFTWDVQISDGSIWLRTQFAWYKLGRPSKAYSPLYEPLVYRYQLSARVGALLQSNFAASYQFIVEQVREPYLDFPGFSEEDIQHEATHILEEVRQLMPDIDPSRQPFLQRLQKLLSSSANKNKWNKSHDTSVVSGRQAGRQRAQNIPTRGSAKRLERTPATVTPLIKELSVGLFNTIVEVKTNGSDNNHYVGGKLSKEKEDSTTLHRDGATVKQKEGRAKWKEVTRTVKWTKLQNKGDHANEKAKEKEGGKEESNSMRLEEEDDAFLTPCSRSASKKRIYYDEASVDGEIIRPGDVVYLRADSAGSESWIGRVIAMWENKPTRSKLFHCRYFRRGHETILGETSGPHELFLTDECVVNPMSSIMGKCSVTFVPPNFITDGRWSNAKRRQLTNENKKVNENDSFFYRFWYDQKTACFEDVSKHDVSAAMMATELPPNYCHACHEKSRKKSEQIPRPFLFAKRKRQQQPQEKDKARIYYDGFAQNGQSYSVNDFVYVLPPDKYIVRGRNSPCVASKWYSCPYEIHQIAKIWRNQRSSRSGGVPVVYVSLRRLYRLTELNEYFSGQKEDNANGNGPQWKPKGDPRELLWSNHLTTRMLSATSPFIEGICVVRKLSDIQEDLNNYIFKSPHTFYMKRTYIGKPLSSDSNNLTTNKKDGKKNKLDELLRALPSSSEEENAIRYSENSKHLETACGRPCDVQDMLHAFNVDPSEASHLPLDRIVKEVESWTSMDEERRLQKKNKKEGPTSGLDRIKARIEPLRALDLFSGCGGFTQGLETSGVVKTCYAVEFMDSAAETLRRNHPDVTVLTGDCNTLLRERIEMDDDGAQTTKTVCLPPKGELDFIYCGPPCQGFSGINRFKKADDVLNSLIAATLSYVDYYRPRYFLLENVRGMISFKLGGQQDRHRVIGGVKMGVVKLIARVLTAMDYQVRFTVLQAGMFGVPQSRRRFFVWGVKRTDRLPTFPQPTHCFPSTGSLTISIPTDDSAEGGGKEIRYTSITAQAAPHPTVTVGDAIGDLPAFEYEDTWSTLSAEELAQTKRGTEQHCVGSESIKYLSPPLSEYQKRLRQSCLSGEDKGQSKDIGGMLRNHMTRSFNSLNVARICNIPKRPGADHRDLPEPLRPWCLSHPDSAASRHHNWAGLYGRLDWEGTFKTALTDISPMGKQGTVLHPNQNRVITLRECARAQGFPDTFVFFSRRGDIKEMHRQVGNAVPPPLGAALAERLAVAVCGGFYCKLVQSRPVRRGAKEEKEEEEVEEEEEEEEWRGSQVGRKEQEMEEMVEAMEMGDYLYSQPFNKEEEEEEEEEGEEEGEEDPQT